MDAVKLEGGAPSWIMAAKAIVEADIAVMGHVGLAPQAISVLGGFPPHDKKVASAVKVGSHFQLQISAYLSVGQTTQLILRFVVHGTILHIDLHYQIHYNACDQCNKFPNDCLNPCAPYVSSQKSPVNVVPSSKFTNKVPGCRMK